MFIDQISKEVLDATPKEVFAQLWLATHLYGPTCGNKPDEALLNEWHLQHYHYGNIPQPPALRAPLADQEPLDQD